MTHYKPSWKDGTETRQEEALWPYVVCTIASRQIVTQNIGIVKAMAKDKAINRKEDVPVVLHLPNGEDRTIVFHPNGTQELKGATRCLLGNGKSLVTPSAGK